MDALKDASHLYEVEHRATHAARPGLPARRPHLVTNAGSSSATFLVLQGMGEYDFVPLLAERG